MSINGVILKKDFHKYLGTNELPFVVSSDGLEELKFKTRSARQSLSISTQKDVKEGRININASDGYVYLTTKRLVFITATQGDLESFVIDLNLAPILQLTHKLQAPWFGANYWQFLFSSAPSPSIASDGFPKNEYFKGELRFLDGGLFEFVDVLNKVLNDVVNNREIDDELPSYSSR